MKAIRLTIDGPCFADMDGDSEPQRFLITVVDGTAEIVREGRPLVERDRSCSLDIGAEWDEKPLAVVTLAVEVAP